MPSIFNYSTKKIEANTEEMLSLFNYSTIMNANKKIEAKIVITKVFKNKVTTMATARTRNYIVIRRKINFAR